MIEVIALAKNWGDKRTGQMTLQEFKDEFKRGHEVGQWSIFADDTAVADVDQVRDGQVVKVLPAMSGG